MDFCTLGMFIIDDIYPPPSASDQTPRTNVIGGAGTYSAIGARLFSPPPLSKSVAWTVDAGTDFPDELRDVIAAWDTGVLLRPRNALTTRGWNGYGENDHRAFAYLTEKKRLTADDLTPEQLASKSFHLICSPIRCTELVQRMHQRRLGSLGPTASNPIIIWEPVPDLCVPAELDNTRKALKHVDVLSPNHEELGALFGFDHSSGVDKAAVEKQAQELTSHGIGSNGQGAIVVRAGKEGCLIARSGAGGESHWLPAYQKDQCKVVDPTGGGNGFLGGLAVGLVRTNFDFVEAAAWGSVAASFCIEQVGMPRLTKQGSRNESEQWNEAAVTNRLQELKKMMILP